MMSRSWRRIATRFPSWFIGHTSPFRPVLRLLVHPPFSELECSPSNKLIDEYETILGSFQTTRTTLHTTLNFQELLKNLQNFYSPSFLANSCLCRSSFAAENCFLHQKLKIWHILHNAEALTFWPIIVTSPRSTYTPVFVTTPLLHITMVFIIIRYSPVSPTHSR